MIKLITDGGLPHPARCCSCGYAGNERFYFWFKYKEKWGQVLICTTCMNEAALLDETGFVSVETSNAILETNFKLRAENDRLELATERFRDRFAGLVADFLTDLDSNPLVLPVEPVEEVLTVAIELHEDSVPAGDGTEITTVDELFEASTYVPASGKFPDADLDSL